MARFLKILFFLVFFEILMQIQEVIGVFWILCTRVFWAVKSMVSRGDWVPLKKAQKTFFSVFSFFSMQMVDGVGRFLDLVYAGFWSS